MTTTERLRTIALRAPLPAAPDEITARIREGIIAELEAVVKGLERHADQTEKLYADLGLEGEREAFAYRTVAKDIQRRIEFMRDSPAPTGERKPA